MWSSSATAISWAWPRPASPWPRRALAAIKAEWKPGPPISGKDLFGDLKRPRQERGGGRGGRRGNSAAAIRLDPGRPERGRRPARSRRTRSPTSRMRRSSRARRWREWEDGKLTVWTGTQRPFGVRGELAAALRARRRRGSRHRARHRRGLRRQAHRRGGRRGGPAGQGGRQARQAGLDPRGRVHLGLLPAGGRDRRQQRRDAATARSPPGSSTTTTPAGRGSSTPYDVPNQLDGVSPGALAAAPGFLSRAGRHGQPLRPRVAHGRAGPRRRHRPAGIPAEEPRGRSPRCGPCSRPPPRAFGWGKCQQGQTIGHRHRRRLRERAVTSPPVPRSPSIARAAACRSSAPSAPSSAAPSSTPIISRTRSKGR